MSSASNDSAVAGQTMLIFGASGDLTSRKLLPALFALFRRGFLNDRSLILGVARREKSHDQFREETLKEFREVIPAADLERCWSAFAGLLHYVQVDIENPANFDTLRTEVEALEAARGLPGQRVAYLATTPDLFLKAVRGLDAAGLIERDFTRLRVVIEKPYGRDLNSARQLTSDLSQLLAEEQIYRIDHYLGKETVQNILLFRFGNSIFEPLFNRRHVDHVQITVAETQGIEGGRGGYYDRAGAMRDVLQNHVLQLMCLVAMEPPALFEAEQIRNEKMKVLQALGPGQQGAVENWAVGAQYAASSANGKKLKAYVDEERIDPESKTETFVALEASIDNWRWAGVPFFLRTGKRLKSRVTEIAVQFRRPPLNLFSTVECEGDMCSIVEARPNSLVFRIQPRESIALTLSAKRPGMQYQVHPVEMDFDFKEEFNVPLPEAYERLLLDVLRGDSTLYTRSDELEAAWRFVAPIQQAWTQPDYAPELYPAGSWGPKRASELLTRSGRTWRLPD